MVIKHKLKMDFANQALPAKIHAVQGDQYTRQVELALYAGGTPWLVPEAAAVVIRYARADGSGGSYDRIGEELAWSAAGNLLNITLSPAMLLRDGPVMAAVDLMEGKRKITTCSFLVMVQPGVAFEKELLDSGQRVAAYLPVPQGARVGQFLKVAQVNAHGVVTKLEPQTLTENTYPGYWDNAVQTVVDKVTAAQDEGGRDCYSFCWFSDSHIAQGKSTPNPGHTGSLARAVMDGCGIPYAIMCGDAARSDGNALTEEAQMRESLAAAARVFAPIGGEGLLQVQGNHDGSWGYDSSLEDPYFCCQMEQKALYNTIFRPQARDRNRVFGGDGSCFYVDDTAARVRYILLNSLWVAEETDDRGYALHRRMRTYGFGQAQLTWLAEKALRFPEEGWDVVIATHVPPLGEYRDMLRDGEVFLGILNAFRAGVAYTGSSGTQGQWDYVQISCDFSGLPPAQIVGLFCGHAHRDMLELEAFPFPVLTVTCDADLSYDDQEQPRVQGTDTEQALDVVTVNRQTGMVTLTRLGVGRDRKYLYGERFGAMYSITHALNGCYLSNMDTAVVGGEAYTARLAVEYGCQLDSITVTMGGQDITGQVFDGETISIAQVFGDLVITAAVIATQGGPNLADAASLDWAENSRLNSSGQVVSQPGSTVTNWISCSIGDVIRITGLDILDAVSGYLMVERTDTGMETTKCIAYGDHFTVENGVISYTVHSVVESIGPYWGGRIRFSGRRTVASGEQIAITLRAGEESGGNEGPGGSLTGTNLADPDSTDWANDSRLNSSAAVVDCTGSCVTNWISCSMGDRVQIAGLDILDATSGYLVIDRTDTGEEASKCASYAQHFTVENGVISYTVHSIVSSIAPYWGGRLRFSGALTADSPKGVQITVTAQEAPEGGETTPEEQPSGNYTNLANPASGEWVADSRLNSAAAVVDCTGSCVTNWIACEPGDVIRIWGLDILNATSGYLCYHRTDTDALESAKLASYTDHFTVENGVISYTVFSISQSVTEIWDGRLRFSGALNGAAAENVIITVNEEI